MQKGDMLLVYIPLPPWRTASVRAGAVQAELHLKCQFPATFDDYYCRLV